MKLKNKQTGEVGNLVSTNWDEVVLKVLDDNGVQLGKYTSLAELNEEWKDAPEEPEEPEYYWYIGYKNDIRRTKYHHTSDFADNQVTETRKEIGNCFESLEEAEKALEKLKAWKRLKDKGFEFEWVDKDIGSIKFAFFDREGKITKEMWQDIDTCFGGEE